MKLAFVWTGFTSYMADCWRELAARSGLELRIWIEEQRRSDTGFERETLMQGLKFKWNYSDQITETELRQTEREIVAFGPDVLFICGWSKKLPPYLASSRVLAGITKILDFDMPWEWTVRKLMARWILRPRLRYFSAAFVPGSSTARYAKWLGFGKVYTGRNCVDMNRHVEPKNEGKRANFIFAGRLVADKNIRLLAKSYCRYRSEGGKWRLRVYGQGPEAARLKGIEGVEVLGFGQPESMPSVYGSAGALVLPSKWEPWGQVLVEAMACGCPVICSSVCGAKEVVEAASGGVVLMDGSESELVKAMHEFEQGKHEFILNKERLLEYSCERWADRVIGIARDFIR